MSPARITYRPLRHGRFDVQVHNSQGELIEVRPEIPAADLRKTVERLAESYEYARMQGIPQDLRTWS